MDRGDTGQRMVNMELSGMKKGRRQQRSFKDVVKEDVQRFGVTEEDSRDRVKGWQMNHCENPQREGRKAGGGMSWNIFRVEH